MTIAIILSICAAIGLTGGLIFSRRVSPLRMSLLIILTLTLSLAGIALSIISWSSVTAEWETRLWPRSRARVISSTVTGQRAFHPDIKYRYLVGDSVYSGATDLHVPAFGGKRKRFDVAEKEADRYKAGDSITIHYNPEDPSQSLIRIGPSYDSFLQFALGLILFMAGIFLVPLASGRRPIKS